MWPKAKGRFSLRCRVDGVRRWSTTCHFPVRNACETTMDKSCYHSSVPCCFKHGIPSSHIFSPFITSPSPLPRRTGRAIWGPSSTTTVRWFWPSPFGTASSPLDVGSRQETETMSFLMSLRGCPKHVLLKVLYDVFCCCLVFFCWCLFHVSCGRQRLVNHSESALRFMKNSSFIEVNIRLIPVKKRFIKEYSTKVPWRIRKCPES